MTPVEKEIRNLETVPDEFLAVVKEANEKLYKVLIKALSELETADGVILSNVSNLQKIEAIAEAIREFLLEGDYVEAVKDYTRTFETHGQVVLSTFDKTAKLSPVYQQYIKQTQANVLNLFDSSAIEFELVNPIKDILTNSIGSSLRFSEAVKTIENFLGEDRLVKYAKTYAIDAFAMFDRNFTQLVNQEYEVGYWEYAGNVIQGTRDFCKHRVGKAFTTDEVESWANETWDGKNPNTTKQSIFTYLGGYQCRHILVPISKERYEKLK